MKRQMAIVLGGGGARGALQVGALRALFQAGYFPHILVGTSIGAINAAFLAIHGVSLKGLDRLAEAWEDACTQDLLPSNYMWLTVRTLFNRRTHDQSANMVNFFLRHGLTPELRFADLPGVRLLVVATDLQSGRMVLFGDDPQESVLEAVLASAALPPWINPLQRAERTLVDGGVVSNLSIQAALAAEATEIIALDLNDRRPLPPEPAGVATYINQLMVTVQNRQTELELAMAAALDVPVRYIALQAEAPHPLWDFRQALTLMERGYELARQEIIRWQTEKPPSRWERLRGRF